ncbi:MAG: hypothetical protein VW338_00015 [Rhodospirillaceae bacterium]
MAWLTPAATGFLLTCLYVPQFMNRATSARWMAASVLVPVLLYLAGSGRKVDWLAAFLGVAFAGLSVLSTLWAISVPDAISRNWHLLVGVGAFLWGAQTGRHGIAAMAVAMGVGMAANSILVGIDLSGLAPHLVGYPDGAKTVEEAPLFVRVTNDPAGTFLNSNYMAEAAVVVIALVAAMRLSAPLKVGLILVTLPCALLGGSRGALVGLLSLAGMWGCLTGRWRSTALLGGLGAILAGVYVAMNLSDPYALLPRLATWANVLASWTWFGNGAGSFLTGYATIHDAWVASPPNVFGFVIRPGTAHNDLLTILFEHGVAGAVLAVGFAARVAWMGWRGPGLYPFGAILVLGLTNFPLYNPLPLVAFCAVCGWISSEPRFSRPVCGTPERGRWANIRWLSARSLSRGAMPPVHFSPL